MDQPSRSVEPSTPGATSGIVNRLSSLAGQNLFEPTKYKGKFASDQSLGEKNVMSQLRGSTFGNNPLYSLGSENLSKTLRGDYLSPETNPYIKNTAADIIRQSQEAFGSTLDDTNAFLNRSGTLFSTSGNYLRGKAMDDFSKNLTGSLSNLYGNAYGQERQNQMGALSQVLPYANAPFEQYGNLLGYEGIPRQIEDANLAGDYNEFTRYEGQRANASGQEYNQLLSLLQGFPLAYPSYQPGRNVTQQFSDVASPLALLMMAMR